MLSLFFKSEENKDCMQEEGEVAGFFFPCEDKPSNIMCQIHSNRCLSLSTPPHNPQGLAKFVAKNPAQNDSG